MKVQFLIEALNPLTPNDSYSGRIAPLTSKRCILYIYSTYISTEYFKHGIYCPFLSLQNAVKGKAIPLQAWSGPEVSRKLRLTDFVTTAQNGGKVASLTHWPPLPPGNTPGSHFC